MSVRLLLRDLCWDFSTLSDASTGTNPPKPFPVAGLFVVPRRLGDVCRFEDGQVTFVPVLRLLGAIWGFEVEERVTECSKCQGS